MSQDNPYQLEDYLREYYGYQTFREYQKEVICNVLSKEDQLVILPTGGGKSLCFQLPAIIMDGCALVITPLIALMQDQVVQLQAMHIPAATLNSMQKESERQYVLQALFSGGLKLLYVSPETLFSSIGQRILENLNISFIAIDEAHCISEWGHDFRPEYAQLGSIKERFQKIPFLALTATADPATRNDIIQQLGLQSPRIIIGNFDRPNIKLSVRRGHSKDDKLQEVVDFIEDHPNEVGIIYCTTQKETETLAEHLCEEGFEAYAYHAGLSPQTRRKVLHAFLNDNLSIVCATVAFGMGINKPNVRWVIHFNMPKNIESYYQEIGRAGRDGLEAEALLFYSSQDLFVLGQLIESNKYKKIAQEKMEYMKRYCEAKICRRQVLLSYFSEEHEGVCNNCDVCILPKEPSFDGRIYAQKAMSAIVRTNGTLNMELLIDFLRGSRRLELLHNGFDKLPTYGVGKGIQHTTWKEYIYQMILSGLIFIDYSKHSTLHVTPQGWKVLYDKAPFYITPSTPTPSSGVATKRKSIVWRRKRSTFSR